MGPPAAGGWGRSIHATQPVVGADNTGVSPAHDRSGEDRPAAEPGGGRIERDVAREQALVQGFFGSRPDGFYVEIGANDPVLHSQTHHLEQLGWEGILVEPQPELCERLRRERPRARVFGVACVARGARDEALLQLAADRAHSSLKADHPTPGAVYVGTIRVPARTLDGILEECGDPRVDFLSIDVEGAELEVLRGLDLTVRRPALLLIEDHVHDLKVHRHLKGQRYRLLRRTQYNNWYVPAESAERASLLDRLRLFRKMYLGLLVRKLQRSRRRILARPKRLDQAARTTR